MDIGFGDTTLTDSEKREVERFAHMAMSAILVGADTKKAFSALHAAVKREFARISIQKGAD